jgi:hypothetical protein
MTGAVSLTVHTRSGNLPRQTYKYAACVSRNDSFLKKIDDVHVLNETCSCCRGGPGKCPVAISYLVLLHNKATDAQAKKDPIGIDLFDKIPDVKREFLNFCKPFKARLSSNVETHRVIAKDEEQSTDDSRIYYRQVRTRLQEAGRFENQPSISGAPQAPISGSPSRVGQDWLLASNGCSTDEPQDNN